MTKYTQRQLKEMVKDGLAEDITYGNNDTRRQLEETEGYYTQVGYSSGVYGCNGMLLKGNKTGKLLRYIKNNSSICILKAKGNCNLQ